MRINTDQSSNLGGVQAVFTKNSILNAVCLVLAKKHQKDLKTHTVLEGQR